MLAPILPSPIIPSCILLFFLFAYLLQFKRRVPLSEGVQEFRSSGVQEFRSSGVQEFRIQEFRSSGVQEFRSYRRRERNFVQTCDIHRSRAKNAISELQRASSSHSATPELLQLLTPSPLR